MVSKERSKQNKSLPKYWRLKYGTYCYRIPPHLRHLHGGKSEISLGQTLSAAYRKFADMHDVQDDITRMSDLFDRYRFEVVTEHNVRVQDLKNRSLDRLRASIGGNLVPIMTPQVIYRYRDHIGRTRSKKQANQDLEVLSHCFTKAIEWGAIAEHPMTNKKVVKFSLPARDRYVEDWELQEWARVANPFLFVYVLLKGVTGLRQQDLLTIRKQDISDDELVSVNIKTNKKLRFPLYDSEGKPTTVRLALDVVEGFYAEQNTKRRIPMMSPWLFHTGKGHGYYNTVKCDASGFKSIWQRSMRKALDETGLKQRFTEHDLRAKVGSDVDSDVEAQKLLAHTDVATTSKHYRRRGSVVSPARGFELGD
jgi:integrase